MSRTECAADVDGATDQSDEHDRPDAAAERATDRHVAGVADGCGCTEIWEHLSDRRRGD